MYAVISALTLRSESISLTLKDPNYFLFHFQTIRYKTLFLNFKQNFLAQFWMRGLMTLQSLVHTHVYICMYIHTRVHGWGKWRREANYALRGWGTFQCLHICTARVLFMFWFSSVFVSTCECVFVCALQHNQIWWPRICREHTRETKIKVASHGSVNCESFFPSKCETFFVLLSECTLFFF